MINFQLSKLKIPAIIIKSDSTKGNQDSIKLDKNYGDILLSKQVADLKIQLRNSSDILTNEIGCISGNTNRRSNK